MIRKYFENRLIRSAFLITIISSANNVIAATSTSSFTVSATVVASCTTTATNLAFGNYTLAQNDASSTITSTCTTNTAYETNLGPGTGPSATTSTRKMTGPSYAGAIQYLSYGLYTDNARTSNWGASAGSGVTGTGNGTAQSVTVYGRIPANQAAATGAYSDTIAVIVTYQ